MYLVFNGTSILVIVSHPFSKFTTKNLRLESHKPLLALPSTILIPSSTKSTISLLENPSFLENFVKKKSNHQLNVQDTITSQEDGLVEGVDATYNGKSAIASEPHEMIETAEEGQPHLLPENDSKKVPEVFYKDNNKNAKVNTVNQLAGDDHRDEKKQYTIPGSRLPDNADSIVEAETLKSEMKKMEVALLGAARQPQLYKWLSTRYLYWN